jgi:hypothetical protein
MMNEQTSNGPTEANLGRVDNEISALSTRLFTIDEKSREILALIAQNGPMTAYELCKSSNRSLSKTSIHRRIYGERQLISLLDENFLRLEGKTKFLRISTNQERKYYGLTLKGFLAALSKGPCEEIYMFKIYLKTFDFSMDHQNLLQHLGKEERDRVWQNFLERIKIDLLLFLQYHDENGMILTYLKHPNTYFGIFWDSIIPLESVEDPLSLGVEEERFSPKWKQIWERRKQVTEGTRITYRYSIENVDTGRTTYRRAQLFFGLQGQMTRVAWTSGFNGCYLTRTEIERWHDHSLPDVLIASYESVVSALREGKIPWNAKELLMPEGFQYEPPTPAREMMQLMGAKQPSKSERRPRKKRTPTTKQSQKHG